MCMCVEGEGGREGEREVEREDRERGHDFLKHSICHKLTLSSAYLDEVDNILVVEELEYSNLPQSSHWELSNT